MPAILTSSAITFSYGDTPVLRDISASLDPGEVVSLIGPNGSGKSTLIKTLIGHLPATGEIAWAGRPLRQWRLRELAKVLAYLPQSPQFEPGQTVGEVLKLGRMPYWGAFGLESADDLKIVRETAELLELTLWLNRPMESLSGGQRQRVFIGRCLAQQPRALLLDEPNTFLDLKHQVELCRLLRKLAKDRGIAVLMASHELNLAGAYADRLMLLSAGAVVASGPPDVVLQPQVLQPVYDVPMARFQTAGGRAVIAPIPDV